MTTKGKKKSNTARLVGGGPLEWAENSNEIIIVVDLKREIAYLNPPALKLISSNPEEVVGKKLDDIFNKRFALRWKVRIRNKNLSSESDYFESLLIINEEEMWLGTDLTPLPDENGKVIAMLGISRDITQTKLVEKQLREELDQLSAIAQIDMLTGLGNRYAVAQRAKTEMNRAKRLKAPLCFGLVDIDNLKAINDTFGHLAGDKALKITATKIIDVLRSYDYAGRWGGDEFLLLLPGVNQENAGLIGERLCRAISRNPFSLLDDKKAKVTASIGLASLNGDNKGISFDDLFDRADKALYMAKQLGRNQFYVYKD